MRVLHIGKYFPPAAGGIERFLGELVATQAKVGIEPSVLAHDPRSDSLEQHDHGPVRRVRAFGEVLFVPISPHWLLALRRSIARCRPQLLHIHMPNPWAFLALLLPSARALPWVIHWHADIPLDHPSWLMRLAYRPYAWFERRLLVRASAIIASSQTYLDASPVLQNFRNKTQVVPLGLGAAPTAGTAPCWPTDCPLKLLAVGRLSYYKGFDVLLRALAVTPGIGLVLIGDGERRAALLDQIATLKLGDRVLLTGRLEDAEIEAAYRACDAFCLPSLDRAEAFGLVLLEAMRAGKPIVSSAVPGSGMCEVVEHQVNGLQVPPGDPQALAAALTALRDQPQTRRAMGAAGQQRFTQRYQMQPVSRQLADVYRRVLVQT